MLLFISPPLDNQRKAVISLQHIEHKHHILSTELLKPIQNSIRYKYLKCLSLMSLV